MPANYFVPLQQKFGDAVRVEEFRDNLRVIVTAEKIYAVLTTLKDQFGFNMLADLAGIDYLGYPDATDRFAVVYVLMNANTAERIFVKTYVNDPDPELPTVTNLWRGADWMEREVFDMFGITFPGHPDLRRILMPTEFTSFPLRKDYPLRGSGERHNFEKLTRAEG
ncbi:NADH-quinone oxidoreductase subunit C [Limnoglobus roseus]|uniref:NADH-quinone oxidoreductase subunit C n=1 Tax=Limnoglobus roseus TaxID=2598579 RepID=A0A5C1AGB3_9BACT|nr:NADH-quinone oxidoreductase subunit C [Limnoglobus roseus]QEL17026.1 NADH-quinone oxidoreductase subunit C [Limnoglobus roseus]